MQPTCPRCQCCAMPMHQEHEFGRNTDGSKNGEYCCYCYQKGTFTDPAITLDKMLEKLATMGKKMGLTDAQLAEVKQLLPTLKRWRK